jgi:ketosteroid isomerase-like protein
MSIEPEDGAVVDRFYAALAQGDVDAMRACCTPGAVFWHSYDRVPLTLDEITPAWREVILGFPRRGFTDVRRAAVPGGLVLRQQMVGETAAGERMAWPLCCFITLQGGLIARLDEYIDRAGAYTPDDWSQPTPGLVAPEADPCAVRR